MSSNKLSQSEIDNLVASLLADGAVDQKADEAKAEVEAAPVEALQLDGAQAPASEPIPASAPAPMQPAPAVAAQADSGELPFEAIQDLGPITQSEVDDALAAYEAQKVSMATSAPVSATTPAAATPAATLPTPAAGLEDPSDILAAALATVMEPTAPVAPAPAAQAAPLSPQPAAPQPAAPQPAIAQAPPSPLAAAPSQARNARAFASLAGLRGVLLDVELTVTVELGRARLSLGDVLALGPGSVVSLEKLANTPVDVKVNGLPLMRAEVLAIGEKYGVRVTESNMKVQAAS